MVPTCLPVTSWAKVLIFPSMGISLSGSTNRVIDAGTTPGLLSLRSSCSKSPSGYSRRVTSYSSANSAAPCTGLRTSAYIMRLPYSVSCVISVFTGALTFTRRTVWCSSVCATGTHTRTTFVPGGMSLTVKEYVKRNVRAGWLNFGFSGADCALESDAVIHASNSDDKTRSFMTYLLLSMVNLEWEIGPRLEGGASSEADEEIGRAH